MMSMHQHAIKTLLNDEQRVKVRVDHQAVIYIYTYMVPPLPMKKVYFWRGGYHIYIYDIP